MKVIITGGNGGIAKGIFNILTILYPDNLVLLTPNRVELDVEDEARVYEYIKKTAPDVLINCAGYIEPSTIPESTTANFIKHFTVNTFAPYWCSKWALNINPSTIIINIGSTSAFEGREKWGAYCSSKAALLSLTETLAREGYKCYAIHPSRTNTPMRNKLFKNEDVSTLMPPEKVGSFVARILGGEFNSGSHIVLKKDSYFVFPMRRVPE